MSEERRKYSRLNWSVEVRWKKCFEDSKPSAPAESATKNISPGGIRMILREGIQVGDVLELDINLGGGKVIHARGRVRWIEKFEITGGKDEIGYEGGVEFMDISDQARLDINRFILEVRSA